MLEKLKGYRTVITAAITSIIGLLVSFGVLSSDVAAAITTNADAVYGAVITIVGVVFAILRKNTDTALGQSD